MKNEHQELALVLRGMVECGPAPENLWTDVQPDGDPYIARAAELLSQDAMQIESLKHALRMCRDELSRSYIGEFTVDERAEAIACADACLVAQRN